MGGDHHHPPEAYPRKDQDIEKLKKMQVPLHLRDTCSHLLIPLEECRQKTFALPDYCTQERHIYEECQYIAYNQRVEAKKALVAKHQAELKAQKAATAAAGN